MSERNLDRQFKTACVKAQIRLRETGKRTKKDTPIFTSTLKFHHLRHTCLSWLGDIGASDMVIKAIAGRDARGGRATGTGATFEKRPRNSGRFIG